MQAYLYYIKIRVLTSLTYRFELIFAILKQIMLISLNVILWKTLFNNRTEINGITFDQMLIFTIITSFLSNIYVHGIEGNLRQRIRMGDVALDYMKPINLFTMFLADDIGTAIVNICQRFLPLFFMFCIFVKAPQPASFINLLLFFVSVFLGFLILWLLSAIFGLLYFWIIDLGPLADIKNNIVLFLSGSMIPIWFFPKQIQEISSFLPFIYTFQAPIDIFIGKMPITQILFVIGVQMFWCGVFYIVFSILSQKALRNVLVQGG